MEKLPTLSAELIRELDKAVPTRCPSLSDDDRAIWFYAGKRAIVEHLLLRLKQTESPEPDQADADEETD